MKQYAESARVPVLAGRIPNVIAGTGFLAVVRFLFWSLAFGVAYTQAPLYTSNQNTKFIVGLADAGLGFLKEDWLANMIDPLPVFSLLVNLTYQHLPEYMFYFFNILMFGVYLHGIAGIASRIHGIDRRRSTYITFLVVIIALHSYAFDSYSMRIFGVEIGQLLHYGVAEQHIIGRIFQPSVFGVFMLLSIYAFLCHRIFLAAFLVALSSIIHPAYMLTSAVVTLSYMAIVFREENSVMKPFAIGLFSLMLVAPVLGHFYIQFSPSSPEIWSKASEILVNIRTPHHMNTDIWLNGLVYAKVALIIIAVYLVRRTRLFLIMLLPLATVVLVTVAQLLSANNTLAASTPWRISVLLVPLSLGIIVARMVSDLFQKFSDQTHENRRFIAVVNSAVLLLLVFYGVNTHAKRHEKYYHGDSIAMMNFVKHTKSPGEHYLVPVELEDFRLYTGAPTFVTFKSVPVKDVEFLEWYKRFVAASDFYLANDEGSCKKLQALKNEYKLTHLVVKRSAPDARCGNFHELYSDDYYRVYRIEKETPVGRATTQARQAQPLAIRPAADKDFWVPRA